MPSAAARSLHAARTAVMKSRNSSAVGPRAGFPACVCRGHSGKEGAHRMGQHGGQNRLSFPAWVEEYYSRKNYGERLNDRGVDDPAPVLWKCKCGCYLHKSRHAVSNNMRRCAPCDPTCFVCPIHEGRASKPAMQAFGLLCNSVAGLQAACTVVIEAHVLPGFGPFDFWLWEWGILVEVDGAHHTNGSIYGVDAHEQMLRDRVKEQAALEAGYRVVRLHCWDKSWWSLALDTALGETLSGLPPRVHCTPFYPTWYFLAGV